MTQPIKTAAAALSRRFVPHTVLEDLLAILTGTLLVSLGVNLFNQAGLLTGGTAGLAFLIHYRSGYSFGSVFFVINLPFYYLAWRRMGWKFTVKTFSSVALVSLFSGLHPQFVHLVGDGNWTAMSPFYVALTGGLMMGVGFIVLFRHQASLGGFNILALYLQQTRGIRAGKLQMGLDLSILLLSLSVVSPIALLASVIGALALNLAISLNHRPGRYMAM